MDKTPTQEIHYLGQMLTSTMPEDSGRIKAIAARLTELNK